MICAASTWNFRFPYGVTLDVPGQRLCRGPEPQSLGQTLAASSPHAAWSAASNTRAPLTNPSAVDNIYVGNIHDGRLMLRRLPGPDFSDGPASSLCVVSTP